MDSNCIQREVVILIVALCDSSRAFNFEAPPLVSHVVYSLRWSGHRLGLNLALLTPQVAIKVNHRKQLGIISVASPVNMHHRGKLTD